ncbi:MAG: Hsp20/alpha crystallin family protein [Candidatus Obscuribacterales bacterium]
MNTKLETIENKQENGNLPIRRESSMFHSLQHEMNRLFDEFRHGLGMGQAHHPSPLAFPFHTRVDVKDTDRELIVTAEVPGVDLDDINLSLTRDGLAIKGEKREEKEEKDRGYYRSERSYGSFYRLIPLPCEVDREKVDASYKDGVLKVKLPKNAEALKSEHKIEVKRG